MRPFQTLIFIFSIFLLLFLLAWIFPEKGIQIGKDIHLKFASLDDYFEEDTIRYADISLILENATNQDLQEASDTFFIPAEDTVFNKESVDEIDTVSVDAVVLRKSTYALKYSGREPSSLVPFFQKLAKLNSQKKLVRILHYGDSQIEADRMSSFIRHKLQTTFGGSGCGTVPAVPLYNGQLSVKQEFSENWDRYTGFANIDSTIGHERYGALMSFVRQNNADTSKGSQNKSWLTFKTSPISYKTSRKYSDVSLFVQGDFEPVTIQVLNENALVDSLVLTPSSGVKKLKWKFKETPVELKFVFSGYGFTNIYGISLDNSWGIALDNIPLRGSSGLVFSNTDTSFLSQMYKMMDVGLVILQFGGNVIPYMKDNYDAYGRYLKRELSVLKRILPGIPVIVIGPSDMSIKEKDKFVTYPNLEGVRDAMKKATLESGFVFWDMYEAMGGKNSMPSWVMADPPLAVSDYVHFNAKGAQIIAEMFSNALLDEYNIWNQKTTALK
jgi:lysophospholipase L1-like esterase